MYKFAFCRDRESILDNDKLACTGPYLIKSGSMWAHAAMLNPPMVYVGPRGFIWIHDVPIWAHTGRIRAHETTYWIHIGCNTNPYRSVWAHMVPSGSILGRDGAHVGPYRPALGPMCSHVGLMCTGRGTSGLYMGTNLALCGSNVRPL